MIMYWKKIRIEENKKIMIYLFIDISVQHLKDIRVWKDKRYSSSAEGTHNLRGRVGTQTSNTKHNIVSVLMVDVHRGGNY